MLRPSLIPLLLATCSAVAWTGCGGDPTQTVPASSLSKAEFVERTEAVCARGRLRGLRYRPAADTEQSEGEALGGEVKSALLPALQDVIDEIYEMGAPSGEEAKTERLLVALQHGVDRAEEIDAPSLETVGELLMRSGKLARAYGLEACIYG